MPIPIPGLLFAQPHSKSCNRHVRASTACQMRIQHSSNRPTADGQCVFCITLEIHSKVQTYLHWSTPIVPCSLPEILQDVADVWILFPSLALPIGTLPFELLYTFNVLVFLLFPIPGHIAESPLLALIDENCTAKGAVEHAKKFGGFGSIFRVVRGDTGDCPWLIMILQATS